jgi:phosphotransferase system enzyme I (PtsP)
MPRPSNPTPKPRVHQGDPRLEAVLDFVAFAARPMPLVTLLDEGPRRIATIFEVNVCSLYLLEGEGNELVMRGNVGFANTALGQVRLNIGEGITGASVEYLRPVSADFAGEHSAYKHFEELGEERYPVFLAVPIRGKAGPLGAIVIQRAAKPFEMNDIELLMALGALVAAGIRHAELIDSRREKAAPRRAGGGTRKVTLPGRPISPGRALGAIAALRRPTQRAGEPSPTSGDTDVRLLKAAFDVAEKAIRGLSVRARALDLGRDASFLSTYVEILGDMRFRQRAMEMATSGGGIPQALGRVAREVTRTAASITRDSFLEERAKDIEDLCDALSMLAAADKRAELPRQALLVGDALTVFDLLISARAHPVGVALTERASGPRTRALLRLLGVPSIVDVQGLFRWASDGDIALLDADHGLIVINPSKSEIASIREFKRSSVVGEDAARAAEREPARPADDEDEEEEEA